MDAVRIAGIAGLARETINCYNSGIVNTAPANNSNMKAAIVFYNNNCIEDCYWLDTLGLSGGID